MLLSLFAGTADELDGLLFATLVTCGAFWCALAFWLARHSPLAGVLQRALRFALPFVLIAVGTYILGHTVTHLLTRSRFGAHQGRGRELPAGYASVTLAPAPDANSTDESAPRQLRGGAWGSLEHETGQWVSRRPLRRPEAECSS